MCWKTLPITILLFIYKYNICIMQQSIKSNMKWGTTSLFLNILTMMMVSSFTDACENIFPKVMLGFVIIAIAICSTMALSIAEIYFYCLGILRDLSKYNLSYKWKFTLSSYFTLSFCGIVWTGIYVGIKLTHHDGSRPKILGNLCYFTLSFIGLIFQF